MNLLCNIGEVFHQYDSIAYPQVTSKLSGVRNNFIVKSLMSLIGASTKEDKIDLPNQEAMQLSAMKFYLDEYVNMLCSLSFDKLDAQYVTMKIMDIFCSTRFVSHCIDDMKNIIVNDFPELSMVSGLLPLFCGKPSLLMFCTALGLGCGLIKVTICIS